MRRERLHPSALKAWCELHDISLNGVEIINLENGMGCGIISTIKAQEPGEVFINVPRQLVLNQTLVWNLSDDDTHLRDVLEACVPWSKVRAQQLRCECMLTITRPLEAQS